ncbi:MAG TPA: RNA polymerase sigma factor [Candidatus Didemnitutus sp.]
MSDSLAPEDRALVAQHLAGDPQAFRRIVERHQGMVCALAYSACGDIARSEDVAQEVFVAAWKQLPRLRAPEKLRGWLGGITRNLAHNSFRQAQRNPTAHATELPADIPVDEADPRERAIGSDESRLMWGALAGLPESYREPMVLFYREGHSVAAIATALEISEDTAKQRLARGRAMLTERMAKLVEETLERSAPKPAFVASVLILLPGPLVPSLLEATGGASAPKALATAGMAGGILAKGGVALKLLSAVAFLPAMMQGATDFIRFNERNPDSGADRDRRRAAWAYLTHHIGIGLFMVAIVVPSQLMPRDISRWLYVPFGLLALAAIQLFIRANIRLHKLTKGKAPAAETPRGFEQCSSVRFLGLPLYHVRLGTRPDRRSPAVKAWIAISDRRAVGGLFAFGPLAVAPVAMGIASAGILDFGIAALGLGAMGMMAGGWWSVGLATAGGYAARGVFVIAPEFTSRASAFAAHGGDALAKAYFEHNLFFQFSSIVARGFMWAAFVGWVMPVMLTGWQLWRTRRSAQ